MANEPKKVTIALELKSLQEYKMVPRAFFLALDACGFGIPAGSPPHLAMQEVFKQEWRKMTNAERLSLTLRMSLAMRVGETLDEDAHFDLGKLANQMQEQMQDHEKQGRKN